MSFQNEISRTVILPYSQLPKPKAKPLPMVGLCVTVACLALCGIHDMAAADVSTIIPEDIVIPDEVVEEREEVDVYEDTREDDAFCRRSAMTASVGRHAMTIRKNPRASSLYSVSTRRKAMTRSQGCSRCSSGRLRFRMGGRRSK